MVQPPVAILILNWNALEWTRKCLASLRDLNYPDFRTVIIDNGSEDGSADRIAREHPEVELLRNDRNRGYAAGNNQGAMAANGEFVCLLNSDTEVEPGALDVLVDFLRDHPSYGAASPRLLNPDRTVQRACMRFPGLVTALCYDTILGKFWPGSAVDDRYFMRDFDHLHSRDVDQPPGACFVMARREYLDMGGLDEDLFLFFNDVDLCRRLWRRGREIRYVAEACVMHHGGASTKNYGGFVVIWHRNRMAYYRKHYGPLVVPFIRGIVRLRGFEEWLRAGRRQPDPQLRRVERALLKENLQEILAR
jgi:GT2 family glycosyltransferase